MGDMERRGELIPRCRHRIHRQPDEHIERSDKDEVNNSDWYSDDDDEFYSDKHESERVGQVLRAV
jgi:hypothetical protein